MNIKKFYRKLASGVLSCIFAVSSLSGAIDASAENNVSLRTLKSIQDDYYYIEPIDTGIPTYSDYYDESGDDEPV